jgi:hypothetical protein
MDIITKFRTWRDKRASQRHEALKKELEHAIFHKGFLLMYCKREKKLLEQADRDIQKLRDKLNRRI